MSASTLHQIMAAGLSVTVLAATLLLGGCANPVLPGTSTEAEVIAYFGKPVDIRPLENGAREFDYPRGPLGRETWRVTLAGDGKVLQVEQLLDEPHFVRLTKGMSKGEVQRELGRHFITTDFSNLDEQVWSWRYTEFGSRFMFFNAHFDAQNSLLKHTSRTPEPILEFRGRGRR